MLLFLIADFQERLRYYSQQRRAKEAAAQAAADADACTFRPDTGNAVQVLALSASRAGNLLESPQARGCCSLRRRQPAVLRPAERPRLRRGWRHLSHPTP